MKWLRKVKQDDLEIVVITKKNKFKIKNISNEIYKKSSSRYVTNGILGGNVPRAKESRLSRATRKSTSS